MCVSSECRVVEFFAQTSPKKKTPRFLNYSACFRGRSAGFGMLCLFSKNITHTHTGACSVGQKWYYVARFLNNGVCVFWVDWFLCVCVSPSARNMIWVFKDTNWIYIQLSIFLPSTLLLETKLRRVEREGILYLDASIYNANYFGGRQTFENLKKKLVANKTRQMYSFPCTCLRCCVLCEP